MQVIVEALEETLAEVHVTNWIDAVREVNATGYLAVPVCPVMLDALHVPLVYNDDDLITLGLIDLLEESLVLLIDQNFLDLGEENIGGLNIPVHLASIEAFL